MPKASAVVVVVVVVVVELVGGVVEELAVDELEPVVAEEEVVGVVDASRAPAIK